MHFHLFFASLLHGGGAGGSQELNAEGHQLELCVLEREDTVSSTVQGHSQGHPAPLAGVSHPAGWTLSEGGGDARPDQVRQHLWGCGDATVHLATPDAAPGDAGAAPRYDARPTGGQLHLTQFTVSYCKQRKYMFWHKVSFSIVAIKLNHFSRCCSEGPPIDRLP